MPFQTLHSAHSHAADDDSNEPKEWQVDFGGSEAPL